ncbi:MAG TPA: PQQ-dependent sugar dehydrogenase, partial [Sphingomonas sp.]|nr:PQQ-dependent sugar dehydrogenase [Sphingomonas sp.]
QGLQEPKDGSNRLFINDTRGILYVTHKAGGTPVPYLDLRTAGIGFSNAANATQTGLMSFAFHPNFNKDPSKPGYNIFYTIDTSAASGSAGAWGVPGKAANHDNIVHEWTVTDPSAATANVAAVREVMRFAQPYSDHGPGTIAFNTSAKAGDADYGKLYIGMGDGGDVNDPLNLAQNRTVPFGKILRIDPADPDGAGPLAYTIPADNPFVGAVDARAEVWAYGLRNPQHFSWDSSGRMIISDIGQAQIDEVDVGVAGANYGWPAREGTYARGTDTADLNIYDSPPNPGFADPIAQYDHEEITRFGGNLASIGSAFLYEGDLLPGLRGDVILTDLVVGRLFYFDPDDAVGGTPATLRELMLTLDGLPTTMRALEGYARTKRVDLRLGMDADGELYMVTKGTGAVYRFLYSAVPEPASWLTMILGFGLIGAAVRRRAAFLSRT